MKFQNQYRCETYNCKSLPRTIRNTIGYRVEKKRIVEITPGRMIPGGRADRGSLKAEGIVAYITKGKFH